MIKGLKISVLTLAVLTFGACSGGGGDSSSVGGSACGVLNARIFNGESCGQGVRSSVVALIPVQESGGQFTPAGICTASFVTVDDLVTSAHCFSGPVSEFGDAIVGFAVITGDEEVFVVVDAALHPLFDGQAGSPFDIAMFTLDRVPDPAISPIPLLGSRETTVGEEFAAFGYGTNNVGAIGELKAAQFSIDRFEGGNIFVTQGSGNGTLCPGDSGGPAVLVEEGVSTMIGINSFGDRDACEGGQGAQFSGFVDIQFPTIFDFITSYAADVAVR